MCNNGHYMSVFFFCQSDWGAGPRRLPLAKAAGREKIFIFAETVV